MIQQDQNFSQQQKEQFGDYAETNIASQDQAADMLSDEITSDLRKKASEEFFSVNRDARTWCDSFGI